MVSQAFQVTKIMSTIFRVTVLQMEEQVLFNSKSEAKIKDCRKIHD